MSEEGERAREEAIERVRRAAHAHWLTTAHGIIERIEPGPFTTDRVWHFLDRSGATTHERRAMGAVMRQAELEGLIRPTSEHRLSTRPECHRRPIRVWRRVEASDR